MSDQMRAVRFHEYGRSNALVVETVPRPAPKANEVLVKVRFAGVNPADWKIRSGMFKERMPVPLPFTPGMDFSGVVEEVGSEVKTLKKGQAVFGIANGTYAELALTAPGEIAPKPDTVSFELAAAVPVGALTAWQAVEDARVAAGQTVVVLGAAGGVGLFAVQLARLKGAEVIGVASAANLAFVESLGAERTVDYGKGPLDARIKDADVVIDTVGGAVLAQAYALAKKGGRLVTVAGQVSAELAERHGITASGSHRGPAELLVKIAKLLADKEIRAEVGRIFPLAEARAAQDLSETGHGRGRILLKAE